MHSRFVCPFVSLSVYCLSQNFFVYTPLAAVKPANPGSPGEMAVKMEREREREREGGRERERGREGGRQRDYSSLFY